MILILLHFPLFLPVLFLSAKYPCLQLRNPVTKDKKEQCGPELHFGSVAVGQSLQKHFDIFNPSPVSSTQYTNEKYCIHTFNGLPSDLSFCLPPLGNCIVLSFTTVEWGPFLGGF